MSLSRISSVLHVLDPQNGRIDTTVEATSFRDFAMNTGTVADRRARRQIEGGAMAKIQALSAFSKV